MQAVGRACEICGEKILSVLDGLPCEHCELAFHHACLLAPAPVEEATSSYRAGAKPGRRRSRRRMLCPSCGADLKREQKARDDAAAARRERHEERRRADWRSPSTRSAGYTIVVVLGLLLLTFALQTCSSMGRMWWDHHVPPLGPGGLQD